MSDYNAVRAQLWTLFQSLPLDFDQRQVQNTILGVVDQFATDVANEKGALQRQIDILNAQVKVLSDQVVSGGKLNASDVQKLADAASAQQSSQAQLTQVQADTVTKGTATAIGASGVAGGLLVGYLVWGRRRR